MNDILLVQELQAPQDAPVGREEGVCERPARGG